MDNEPDFYKFVQPPVQWEIQEVLQIRQNKLGWSRLGYMGSPAWLWSYSPSTWHSEGWRFVWAPPRKDEEMGAEEFLACPRAPNELWEHSELE